MTRQRTIFVAGAIVALALAAAVGAQQTARPLVVDANVLKAANSVTDPNAGLWLSYGKNPYENRYSPLNLINTSNVGRLGLSWTYELGAGGGDQEATPLFWNNTLYVVTNWSVVHAIDARTGKMIWKWDPEINQQVRLKMCCGIVNRGLALAQGMIFLPANDGRLIALDALTGKPVWEARVAYPQDWYSLTMAPRVAGNKVLIGVAGGDHPTRGFFDAYDIATGRRAWRFYTVPGDPKLGFENKAMEAAAKTWGGDFYKWGGGGAVWDGMAWDPDANLVYVGTGNAEPWVEKFRGAQGLDNLYTCSILAVDVNTGQLKWHYQVVPNDNWDYDAVQHLLLADLNIKGRMRKVIMQASKNGFFYVLDRITGELISAEPYTQVSWAKGIDMKTGRPIVHPEAFYGKDPVTVWPTAGGGHNWSPMSFHPGTGLVYIPTTYGTWTFVAGDEVVEAQTGHTGLGRVPSNVTPKTFPTIGPPPMEGNPRGVLHAWDPVNQKLVWRVPGGGGRYGGTVATGGNLVFQVINDGKLMAYSADKGELLLELPVPRTSVGPPITYLLDGKQYVAFAAGSGRPANVVGPNDAKVDNPPLLFVFELDGKGVMPPAPLPAKPQGPPPAAPKPAAPKQEPELHN
jgi:quinohemoprotein ethanol dehydrogenase